MSILGSQVELGSDLCANGGLCSPLEMLVIVAQMATGEKVALPLQCWHSCLHGIPYLGELTSP